MTLRPNPARARGRAGGSVTLRGGRGLPPGRGLRGPDDCVRHLGGLTAPQEWRHPADRVVLVGWCRKAGCLAAVTARAPSSQAIVVQVVQECGQELSGGRQPGIEVPLELFGRLLAIRPVTWSSTLSRLLVRIWYRSWLDRVVPHRRRATAVIVWRRRPTWTTPPGRQAADGRPSESARQLCDHLAGLG